MNPDHDLRDHARQMRREYEADDAIKRLEAECRSLREAQAGNLARIAELEAERRDHWRARQNQYETTVHDKRTGDPVGGCDGDALARIAELEDALEGQRVEWDAMLDRAEQADRYREALERIANHDWTEPPSVMPDEMARQALSGGETG